MAIRDYANKNKNKAYSKSAGRSERSTRSSSSRRTSHVGLSKRTGGSSFFANFSPMMFLVIVIGAMFISSILYLEYAKGNLTQQKVTTAVNKTVTATKENIKATQDKLASHKAAKPEQKNLPKFEFYHTLPKMEVAVEDSYENSKASEKTKRIENVNKLKSEQQSHNKSVPETQLAEKPKQVQSKYSLQLASFKDYNDAEELKVKLILAGFDVIIQTVKLDNGEVWHRVKSQKFTDVAQADYLSAKLRGKNINSMLVVERT